MTRITRDRLAALGLFALAVALYARTVSFGFQYTWDDGTYVYDNPFITAWTWDNLVALFDRPYEGLYGPVQMLSYTIDYRIWGLNPAGFHLGNVVLHAANTVLAFFVLRRLAAGFGIALFAATVFAVHPLNVENVAWIAERKTLVSAFFLLAAVLGYIRYRADGGHGSKYALALVCFALAVFSKATVVGLPLVLGAYELFMRAPGERRYTPLIPFFAVAAFAAVVTLFVTVEEDVVGSGQQITAAMLFGAVYPTMLAVWWEYVRMLLLPVELSAYYIPTIRGFADPVVLFAAFAWIVTLERIFFRAPRAARFWFVWSAVLFAPTSGLVPWVVYYADRYMYLPGIGVYVMAGMAAGWLFGRLAPGRPWIEAHARGLTAAGIALVAIVYGGLAYQRSAVWADEVSLWLDTTQQSPTFADGHVNLGAAYLRLGRLDEAEVAYRRGHEMGNAYGTAGLKVVEGRRRLLEKRSN